MKTPNTLEESHTFLEKLLGDEDITFIDKMVDVQDMCKYHFTLGRKIRNDWGLWAGGPLKDYMNGLGFYHPDDISATILDTFWCKRHQKPFDLEIKAEYYRQYWENTQTEKNFTIRIPLK